MVSFSLALTACGSGETVQPFEPPPGDPEPFSVMTFNVLCSFCGGGEEYDTWDERQPYFKDLFARHDPDLIGLQELSFDSEVTQMLELLDGYEAVFYHAPESLFTYPDATVLFRASRFERIEEGFYWLSPTPDVASSSGFAPTQFPRLVAFSVLRDRVSHRSLMFATTHFDNNSPSQELSAPLVLERTSPFAEAMPVVLVGDFNSDLDSDAYATLTTGVYGFGPLVNAQTFADDTTIDTNQDPAPDYDLQKRIDHIFVAGENVSWSSPRWTVDMHRYGPLDRYPSDHFAMVAELEYAAAE